MSVVFEPIPRLARIAIIAFALVTAVPGCTTCTKGMLPKVDLLKSDSRASKPSLAYAVSFSPPEPERDDELRSELVQELTQSQLFQDLQPQLGTAEIALSIELIQVNLTTGRAIGVYFWTGGLWPVQVSHRYELTATVRQISGLQREYTLIDQTSCRVWAPGLLQHSLGDFIEPRVAEVRRNLYRTLLKRMADDNLLLE